MSQTQKYFFQQKSVLPKWNINMQINDLYDTTLTQWGGDLFWEITLDSHTANMTYSPTI